MLKFAIRNLLSRPLRSLLSLLGLTVAIAGMVGLFSVAYGLDRIVGETFSRIPGLIAMQPGAPIPLFSTLPASWGEEIAGVPGVHVVSPEIWQRANVIDGTMILSPPRFLFGTDLVARSRLRHPIYEEALVAGRFLAPADGGTYRCVISRPIAEEFGRGVGDRLHVNGFALEIVGIYFADSLLLDVAIILDINQVRRMTRFREDSVSSFYIEPAPGVDDDELVERIRALFRGREIEPWAPSSLGIPQSNGGSLQDLFRRLDRAIKGGGQEGGPAEPQTSEPVPPVPSGHRGWESPHGPAIAPPDLPIEVRRAEEWGEQFERFSEDLDLFLVILTGIGVTIAVLSIVNTMVMSVSERIIEFGVLKANGWSKLDVLKLVTSESAVLGFGGGVLGALAGWGATHLINWYFPDRVELYASPRLLIFSVGFSTALGVLGGLYPAYRAMQMLPMDAIRRG